MSLYYYREGHFEATELLLDHGANLNIPSGSNDDTPLTLACWKGHDDVVTLLLERQSSINHQTKTGCTPLMEATRYTYMYTYYMYANMYMYSLIQHLVKPNKQLACSCMCKLIVKNAFLYKIHIYACTCTCTWFTSCVRAVMDSQLTQLILLSFS